MSEQQAALERTGARRRFRLLADSGFGGERSRGWGRARDAGVHRRHAAAHDPARSARANQRLPSEAEAALPTPREDAGRAPPRATGCSRCSHPAAEDSVDWNARQLLRARARRPRREPGALGRC